MVTLHFKLSELGTVQMEIDRPVVQLAEVLQHAAGGKAEPGSFIITRGGKVIGGQTLIADGDEITLFPALSGG